MNEYKVEFTGIQELDNASRNLKQSLYHITDTLSKEVQQQVHTITANVIQSIKNEMLGSFQAICYEEFQKVFYKYYGNNYDINSLNNSLSFYIDDNLRPYLSYIKKDFTIAPHFIENKRTFNQNARIEGSFGRLMDFDELEAMEEMDFYGLSFATDDPYDYATEEMEPPEDYRVFKNKKILLNPDEVYKKAENAALMAFKIEYEKYLKPYFRKKYGIIL